jgi:hypothetical protein
MNRLPRSIYRWELGADAGRRAIASRSRHEPARGSPRRKDFSFLREAERVGDITQRPHKPETGSEFGDARPFARSDLALNQPRDTSNWKLYSGK